MDQRLEELEERQRESAAAASAAAQDRASAEAAIAVAQVRFRCSMAFHARCPCVVAGRLGHRNLLSEPWLAPSAQTCAEACPEQGFATHGITVGLATADLAATAVAATMLHPLAHKCVITLSVSTTLVDVS